MTFEDIVFVLRERSMLHDLAPPSAPLPPSIIPPATPIVEHRKPGRPPHTGQFTARKKTPLPIAEATLAGSSSRQPHHDPHAAPSTIIPTHYRIVVDLTVVRTFLERWEAKEYLQLRPEQLQWSPFLVTRGYGLDLPVGSIAKDPGGDFEMELDDADAGAGVGFGEEKSMVASLNARVGNGLGTIEHGPATTTTAQHALISPLSQLLAASAEAQSSSFSSFAPPASNPTTAATASSAVGKSAGLSNGHDHSAMQLDAVPTRFSSVGSPKIVASSSKSMNSTMFAGSSIGIVNGRMTNGTPRRERAGR